jgi:hypothetical protein
LAGGQVVKPSPSSAFAAFDRRFLESDADFSVIGTGELGGKAKGLAFIRRILAERCPPGTFRDIEISIPRLAVVATDVFVQFMERNRLYDVALSGPPDERIAHAFLKAELPPLVLGDLRAAIDRTHTPLAVRSSSLLEDALNHPFAGIYATKMIPNNQPDAASRFARLVEAIKFIYASTFFAEARSYRQAIGQPSAEEQMAVIIQEVVGRRHGNRFYPDFSGVIRTYNFYPTGPARPEDGVVSLALGLGKTIVDGGRTWCYSPAYPSHGPPYGSVRDMLSNTQTAFWAVNLGQAPYDPVSEIEYLIQADLTDAEYDGVLDRLASTYDPESDRLIIGTGRRGPRVINFAPLLELDDIPLNPLIQHIATICREAVGADVEIEFAMTLDDRARPGPGDTATRPPHRFGFLQLRPTQLAEEAVEVPDELLRSPRVLVYADLVLGNGARNDLTDVVYVRPETFSAAQTRRIAAELELINRELVAARRPYLLIGFGRWGSSDPWLGIPVNWGQISGARVIVEATLPQMNVEPSQGSHFFHNMTSFRVPYLTVRHDGPGRIDFSFLDRLSAEKETDLVRHVRTPAPLEVRVNCRIGRGLVLHG